MENRSSKSSNAAPFANKNESESNTSIRRISFADGPLVQSEARTSDSQWSLDQDEEAVDNGDIDEEVEEENAYSIRESNPSLVLSSRHGKSRSRSRSRSHESESVDSLANRRSFATVPVDADLEMEQDPEPELDPDNDEIRRRDSSIYDVDVGYSRASSRLNGNTVPSRSRNGSRSRSRSRSRRSRDVRALPLEIPENPGPDDDSVVFRYLAQSYDNSYQSVGSRRSADPPTIPLSRYRSLKERPSRESYKKINFVFFAIVSLALLSSSVAQLRFLIAYSKAIPNPGLHYLLTSMAILIEIAAGIGFVLLTRLPSSDPRMDRAVTILIVGLFIVAMLNIVLAVIAVDDHVCEVLAKQTNLLDVVDQTPEENGN